MHGILDLVQDSSPPPLHSVIPEERVVVVTPVPLLYMTQCSVLLLHMTQCYTRGERCGGDSSTN